MKITKKEVEYVASLAQLELSEEEKETFTKQLDSILAYVEKLNELDTRHIEPTSHVLPIKNIFRDDDVEASITTDDALSNAPDQQDGYFKVPRIIEEA